MEVKFDECRLLLFSDQETVRDMDMISLLYAVSPVMDHGHYV